jgi:hypothetical protein
LHYIGRADDGACPRPHEDVIAIIVHSIAHSSIADPLLPPLQLLQQPEAPRHCEKNPITMPTDESFLSVSSLPVFSASAIENRSMQVGVYYVGIC